MNHLCENCQFKYEPTDILDYYQKTGKIPNIDWSFPDLRSSFWLCQNEHNSPKNFSNQIPSFNRCEEFNTFGTCPFYIQSDAENIAPITFEISPLEKEVYIDDAVTLTATPKEVSPDSASQIYSFAYQWYRNGRKLFKEKKQSFTPDTSKLGSNYYHCVITETIADNNDGGMKSTQIITNSIPIDVIEKV